MHQFMPHFIKNRATFDEAMGLLMPYIERNACYEMQKAFSIVVMGTAVRE